MKFIRQDAHKKSSLGQKWRKPRGIQSKPRFHLSGYKRGVAQGFRSQVSQRNLINGKLPKRVHTLKDLEGALTIIIASTTGAKKVKEIITKALAENITILNIKDPKAHIKAIDKKLEDRKAKKSNLEQKKAKETKKTEKKEDKKSLTAEEQEAKDKKEKDKLLTKPEK